MLSCKVRNNDWLVVVLDEPECAGKDSLAQLVNTGQPCVYRYLLFKVCAPQKFVVYRIYLSQQN